MPAASVAYAKNTIRRALRELVDPSPDKDEVQQIWRFFDGECAYCGRTLIRKAKEGHIDHLVSASKGGPNHISNRVLACAPCNESEKREMDWDQFLRMKNLDLRAYQTRRDRILQWRTMNPPTYHVSDPDVIADVTELADQVIQHFETVIQGIRREYG